MNDSAAGSLSHLWRSVGFRLVFYYGFLVTITMIVTVIVVYMQTVIVLDRGMERQITLLGQEMAARFHEGGAPALAQEVVRALADGRNSDTEIFLYVDPGGSKIAGNLDKPPRDTNGRDTGRRMLVARGGQQVMAYVSVQSMPDGSRLFVGSDFRDQQAIESLVTGGIEAASVVALVLLIGGLFAFRHGLERSVEGIRRTLTRVATGAIEERVKPTGRGDEFALLANDINTMLDRIELLMNGVRHVSDAIAHNLRTPLTRILSRLRTVAEAPDTSAAHRQIFDDAAIHIEDLIAVFEKLLQIAEAEAGARRIPFEPVSITSVIREVIDFYEVVADQQGATLRCETSDDAIVLGDPGLLASAIANLVDNALKYGGTGATVTVESSASRDQVLLAVTDNGPGVPERERTRLGTRFLRLDRSVPGHGLGVAGVAAVVALHGGHIRFDDAGPGLIVRMEFARHTD